MFEAAQALDFQSSRALGLRPFRSSRLPPQEQGRPALRGTRRSFASALRCHISPLCLLLAFAGLLGLASAAGAQQGALPDPDSSADRPVFSFDSPLGPVEYVAGRGLRVGSGLTIGGFTTLELDDDEAEPGSIELDSVNFLVLFEPIDALRFFAELEVGNLLRYEFGADVDSNPEVNTERLYLDLSRGDSLNVRLGKFQTPVGRWNLVPAEPFVWTASDPVLVERAFDEHQTGGALFGSFYPGSHTLSYWLYGQFVDPLDPDPDAENADRSVGGRLEFGEPLGDWSVGTSLLLSERKDDWNTLGGLDAVARIGPLELTTEFAAVSNGIPERSLWGIYLQGVYDLGSVSRSLRDFYFVARYEHLDPRGTSEDANLWDLGITWIPVDYLNVKAGYRLSDRQTEDVRDGLTASLSVLF